MIKIPRIVIVEDSIALREALEDHLASANFDVRGVDDGEELNAALAIESADAIVLDLNLPNEDGLSIARRMRQAFPEMGILMLTARVRSVDRSDGYESGADVYLTKPVKPEELTMVLQALCRRIVRSEDKAAWTLNLANLELLTPAQCRIPLSLSEGTLIYELAVSGELLSVSRLVELFGEVDLPDATNKVRIEQIVSRLRKKMEPHLEGRPGIKAVPRLGYRLFVPIQVKPMHECGSSNFSEK